MFYSEKNSSKLCTEGAIGNLMNVLHCSENKVKQFWDIVQLPVHLILQILGLVGNARDVTGTCHVDTTKSANFGQQACLRRHPFLPIWPFPHVLMSGNGDISIGMQKYYSTIIYTK